MQLPDSFDPALVGDDSTLPEKELELLRELVWRKCESDPMWFIENFWHVIDPAMFGWTKFRLRDYQKDDFTWLVGSVLHPDRQRKLVLKARQIGWTTMAAAVAFWDVYFRPRHPWLIASQGEDEAKDTLFSKIREPYEMLPRWMRKRGPKITDQNSERMTFDNGSSILSIPATGRAGRSKAVFGVLLDEFAFAGDPAGMLAALDPLCYGPLIVFSTAFGMGNKFHDLWVESQRHDSEWDSRFRPWHVVPGRDDEWYAREKRKARDDESRFYQEYPTEPEEAFAKTGRTVLPMKLLRENHNWDAPNWRYDLGEVDLKTSGLPPSGATIEEDNEYPHELWVWEPPTIIRDEKNRVIQTPNYVVGCDVAEGLDHGDRTSIWVWDANTLEVVATYRGHWPVQELGALLEWLGYTYHTALVVVERNNHGLLPLDYLRRHEYPRLYRMAAIGQQVRGDRTPRYGWHTNRATKPLMVKQFVKGIVDDTIRLHDSRLLSEASVFVGDGRGSYGAAPGNHDDHVLGAMIGYAGVLDVGQYPTVFYDDEPFRLTWAQVAELSQPEQPLSGLDKRIGAAKKRQTGTKAIVV